jgi:geranylgeranyl diphosphate synthase, type I
VDTLGAVSQVENSSLRERVEQALDRFMAHQASRLMAIDPVLAPVTDAVRDFLDGGKRLRPAFCYWGWRGAGAQDCPEIIVAAASLELLQAAALIHDDLMDDSNTRRGKPSIHRQFGTLLEGAGRPGRWTDFGAAAAILIGDLCLSWCDAMIESSGIEPIDLLRAKPTFQDMRTELMAGQYLDVLAQATGGTAVDGALRVIRYKAAKYTVERPLHVGGLLAGGQDALIETYSAYGLPIGEAFQLRDDILGVFGDPAETGKPAGDDLREGKRTLLVALAFERAGPAQRDLLERTLGDPMLDDQGVDALRVVLVETGALAAVEELIERLTVEALRTLDGGDVAAEARDALRELAVAATVRAG